MPLGLDKENPFLIMVSKRWQKSPASIMFKELFKYIAGVNQVAFSSNLCRAGVESGTDRRCEPEFYLGRAGD
jgi:hypothetical protein